MPTWRGQTVIEAPVASVWDLVADPARYPEWASDVVEVTGLAEVAEQATFEQTSRMPGRAITTTYEIDRFDDLHEIRLRCTTSGYYSHWVLTPARDATFAEVEFGVEPTAPQYRLYFGLLGKRYLRRAGEQSLDGLRRLLSRPTASP